MARYLRLGEQFFDNSGAPLSGGKLKFFESGAPLTDPNKKDTYSDSGETTANTNPVVLDSAGRASVDIWFSGAAQVQLLTSADVQLDLKDPVPAQTSAGQDFSDWNGVITYSRGDIVLGSDSNYYRSITNSNLNNNPTSTSGEWEQINFVGRYDSAQTYAADEVVVDPADSNLYLSLVASNTGNTPNSSPSQWKVLTAAGNVSGPGSSTDNAIARFDGTGGTVLQNSSVTIDDSGNITFPGDILFSGDDPEILGGDTDGELYISPSTSVALGANIIMYGDTHATLANDMRFRSDTTDWMKYDDSASQVLIDADAVNLRNAAANETLLAAANGGAVSLYFNNSAKVATTNTGATVTGTVVADGITIGATASSIVGTLTVGTTNGNINSSSTGYLELNDSFRSYASSHSSKGDVSEALGDFGVPTPTVPASASDTGIAGHIAWDANYIYVCTATNTWKRAALSTW